MEYGLAALVGYLFGAIPVSLLVARRHGVDLRRTGDGNPGAWNALEQLGARRAWPAFVGDGAKALVPAAAAHLLWGFWPAYAAVAGAMAGHAFPVFAGFRGGKSVMTFVGGAFALAPLAAVACLVLCLAVTAATAFKWGARAAVLAFPLVQLALDPVAHVMATGVLMTLIGLLFLLRSRPRVDTGLPHAG
jgi:acyl phosphate:glycerol-3-phosphate acyltransferase